MKYTYKPLVICRYFVVILITTFTFFQSTQAQVTPNINSGNPAFPFPQFLDYGQDRKSLASQNAPGMTHAEMELRTREAWKLVCNNTSPYAGAVVSGVQYLYPTAPTHCTCVEGDGYYLLGAALMGDKIYFDGYYMWAHDRGINGVKRFIDGAINNPNYDYSKGLSGAGKFGASTDVLGGAANNNSATDGDVDFALALLIAYKQWGEHSGIILNHGGWGGKEINYKEEALRYIRAMVDTVKYAPAGNIDKFVSGVIGLDGYLKNGDSWSELTNWAVPTYNSIPNQNGGNTMVYFDYNAPAWLKQYRVLLESENDNPFLISQLKRGEASADWLMGELYSQNPQNIPVCGEVKSTATPTEFEFHSAQFSEDFRAGWRTVLNYVWHDNPTYTWNPVTHEVEENNPNTYEKDMGLRFAKFLKNPQSAPWNNPCTNVGDLNPRITFRGPYTLNDKMSHQGVIGDGHPLNWIHGAGAPSAIAAQDFDLMGEMFRHCVIAWDNAGDGGPNLASTPKYFHEWYRLCGMLILAGNFHAPENMEAQPNLKVYHKVDKTFGFTGDQMLFTVSYRNYGSVDAVGTVVKFGIPAGFQYISSTKGGLVGDSVVWNVGAVKGFKTGGLNATIDSMKIVLKVGPSASGRYCTNARIYSTNGLGWTSDEYPNNITAVMERNCVDVVKRALQIEKTASRKEVNPATNGDIVYKIKFENSSDAGWINGGRPGVRVAFAHKNLTDPTASADNELKFRIFHDAAEPYIDFGNYRVSYFMNDPNIKGYSNNGGTATWGLQNTIAEGVDKNLVKVTHEQIVPGSDANGSWNQRIMLQFSPQLATITQHLQKYAGSPDMVHEGGMASLRGVWRMYTNNYINTDWSDDWSWDPTKFDGDDGIYFPISDDYTDPDNLGLPINSWHRSACQTTTQIVKNVLVEEWDGYVWRRVMGNGPVPGRDITNVIVTDTLPQGVAFKNFIRQTALGVTATTSALPDGRTLIKWSIPKMQVNQKDSIIFTATVTGTCPGADRLIVNKAWIEGNSESAISESDTITVTCNAVTICPDPTTLTKISDKPTYVVNDPVTYTLSYTQTQGSIANPDLSTSADWTAQSGSIANASFSAGKASIGQINGDLVLTHDYSYGTNTLGDGIEGTIQITSYAKAAIVVRHGGGSYNNGVFVVIKPAYPSSVDVYNGTTLVGSGTFPDQTPPSIDFRIKLIGDKLDLWIGPTPTAFSGAPSMSYTGITVQPGWVGFSRGTTIGDPSGTGTISSWRTHMDAAFDVVVTDPLPSGITTPSAISNSGTDNAGVITWNLASGKTPLPYGSQHELTWQGVYSVCQKVTNVAYVNTKGLPLNTFGVCYDINCGTAPPVCTPPTSAVISGVNLITEGSTTSLTATITPATTGWVYNWYKLPDITTPLAGSGLNNSTLSVSDSGRYIVRVVSPTDPLCSVQSAIFTLDYIQTCISRDSVGITLTELLEAGTTTTLTATPYPAGTGINYQWYKLPDVTTPLAASGIDATTLSVSDTGRYFVIAVDPTDPTCQVVSKIQKVDYLCEKAVINAFWNGAPILLTDPINLCEGESGVLSFAPQKYNFEYDIRQLSGTPLMNGIQTPAGDSAKVTINSANSGTWFLSVYSDPGNMGNQFCWDFADIKTISIDETTKPVPVITATPDSKYCAGQSGVTLTANTGVGYTYIWSKDDIIQTAGTSANVVNNATSGKWKVKILAGGSCADSTELDVMEEVTPTAEFATNATALSYCPGSGGTTLLAKTTAGMQYQFLKDNLPVGAFSASASQLADVGSWQVVFENAAGCKDTSNAVVVTQSSNLTVDIAGDTTLCSGETLELSTNLGTSTITWTLPDNSQQDAGELILSSPVSGLYKAYYEDGAGCSGKDSVNVLVEPASPNPAVSILDKAPKGCSGDEIIFTAQLADATNPVIEWYINASKQTSNIEEFKSNILQNGDKVKVFITSDSKCNGTQKIGDSVNVVIIPLPIVEITSASNSLCQGGSLVLNGSASNATLNDYEWLLDGNSSSDFTNSIHVTEGGSYTLKGTDIDGCIGLSDPFIVQETILPVPTISSSSSEICAGSQIDISSDVTDPSYSYSWTDENDVDLGISGSVATITNPGTYKMILTSEHCQVTSNALTISNLVLEAPLLVGNSFPVCEAEGEFYTVSNLISNAQYNWSVPSGSQIVTQRDGFINVNLGDQDGVISVYATNGLGCESPVGELTVNLQLCGFKAKIGYDKSTICPGETIVFESQSTGVTSGTTYLWNFGSGASPATYDQAGPVSVVFSQPGLPQVSLTIVENGVSKTTSLSNQIQVNSRPVISEIDGPGMVCLNTDAEYSVTVSSNVQVRWISSNNLIQKLNPNTSSVIVNGIQSGIGTIEAFAQSVTGCYSDTVSKDVFIEEKPSISLSSDRNVLCNSNEATLTATSSSNDIQWFWNGQLMTTISGDRVNVIEPGEYLVSTGSGNCIAISDTVFISNSGLAVDAGLDRLIDIGQSTQLIAISNATNVSYRWEPGMLSLPAPTVSPTETTLYTVIVTDVNGCQAQDDVLVTVVEPLFIPNAFTPNGDGVHDVWEVTGLERYNSLTVEVFNRWGQLVYKSNGTYKPWDGTLNGVMLPVATYYYVIDGGGTMKPFTGAVLLSK